MRHSRFGPGRGTGSASRWQQRPSPAVIPPPAPQHPPSEPPHAKQNEAFIVMGDHALNEAIRRSLEDQKVGSDIFGASSQSVATSTLSSNESHGTNNVVVETVNEKEDEVEYAVAPEVTVNRSEEKDIALVGEDTKMSSKETTPSKPPSEFFSYANSAESPPAAFVGATLDKMAEAIDGLNWELNNKIKMDAVVGEVNEVGAKILDGNDDDTDDEEASDYDSWQHVAQEEHVANAAQTLGSALFSSNMERSIENMSNLSNSIDTGFSSATGLSTLETVPSAVRSLATDSNNNMAKVAPIQLQCWAPQLQQLHELGFTNDSLSIDLLEQLNAANIGVDSDEEVSVQQVINAMMKDT
jgi:hypothetical protein